MALKDYHSALVTGASSGIGAAVVRSLTEKGITVHAVARRKERLDQLAEATGCIAHVLDLRDTDKLYDTISGLEVDVVVNNAGLGRGFERLFEGTRKDVEATIDTNIGAGIHVLRATLPEWSSENEATSSR